MRLGWKIFFTVVLIVGRALRAYDIDKQEKPLTLQMYLASSFMVIGFVLAIWLIP